MAVAVPNAPSSRFREWRRFRRLKGESRGRFGIRLGDRSGPWAGRRSVRRRRRSLRWEAAFRRGTLLLWVHRRVRGRLLKCPRRIRLGIRRPGCMLAIALWRPHLIWTYTAVDEEPLEASDSHLDQWLQLFNIAGHDTAIKANIDPTLSLCSSNLLLEACNSCSRRDSIQRHINHRRHTAKRSCSCTSPEAFPFCSSRFIQMHMCIYQSWNEDMR
jgi:hypothetical protein